MLRKIYNRHTFISLNSFFVAVGIFFSVLFFAFPTITKAEDLTCPNPPEGKKNELWVFSYDEDETTGTITKKICIPLGVEKTYINIAELSSAGLLNSEDIPPETEVYLQGLCPLPSGEITNTYVNRNDLNFPQQVKQAQFFLETKKTIDCSSFSGNDVDKAVLVKIRYKMKEKTSGDDLYLSYKGTTPYKEPPGSCWCRTGISPVTFSSEQEKIDSITTSKECAPGTLADGKMIDECTWKLDISPTPTPTTPPPQKGEYNFDINSYVPTEPNNSPLPPCAYTGSCRNVNDLLQLLVNAGKFALGLVGSVALVFFVYGGFTMVMSMGSPEKVKKGRDILVAAVIGIIIAFSAYAIVNFVLDALGVSSDFRVVNDGASVATASQTAPSSDQTPAK